MNPGCSTRKPIPAALLPLCLLLAVGCGGGAPDLEPLVRFSGFGVYATDPEMQAKNQDSDVFGPRRRERLRLGFLNWVQRRFPEGYLTDAELDDFIARNGLRCDALPPDMGQCAGSLTAPRTGSRHIFSIFPGRKTAAVLITFRKQAPDRNVVVDFAGLPL